MRGNQLVDEFHCVGFVGRALGHQQTIDIHGATFERIGNVFTGGEDTLNPVVAHVDHVDFTVTQQLRRLRSTAVPNGNVRRNLRQLLPRTFEPFLCGQDLIDVSLRHPVSHQRGFEVVVDLTVHRAFTREFFQVEEISPALWAIVAEFILLIGDHLREVDESNIVAVDQTVRNACCIDRAVVQRLQHAVAFQRLTGRKFLLCNIPGDIAGRDLNTDVLYAVCRVFFDFDV